jgi:putative ABC transport system substrate-binding protein
MNQDPSHSFRTSFGVLICDFGMWEENMNKRCWTGWRDSSSDNPKSKTCTELSRSIQNRKLVGIVALVVTFAMCGAVAQAQQPAKVPRIGFVSPTGDPNTPGPQVEGFRQGLQDLGYMEGKNIVVEYRYTEGKGDRNPSLVAELVQLKVDVLVVSGPGGIQAAKQATKTIPIVILSQEDPVAAGYIDSLARPGGNITGLTRLIRELSGKRLELLTQVVPKMSRVGVLWDTNSQISMPTVFKDYEAAARALKIKLQSLDVRGPNDFEGAFRAAAKGRANALMVIRNPLHTRHQKQIADFAIKNQLPSMYEASEFVEAGGLASYSSNEADQFRRAAYYVDRILKGAKPADLPVEQPTKFELVINLKTAKHIGLTIPPEVLARANRLIR